MDIYSGGYVMYKSGEICRIEEIDNKCFDGVNSREYYTLVPVNSKNSKYYVPSDCASDKIRSLLTKEQILEVIDGIDNSKSEWYDNAADRKSHFTAVLSGDDHRELIGMVHSLYFEQQKRVSQGKKMLASDEKALKAARELIDREFAFVLGIEESDVAGFIKTRLEHNK